MVPYLRQKSDELNNYNMILRMQRDFFFLLLIAQSPCRMKLLHLAVEVIAETQNSKNSAAGFAGLLLLPTSVFGRNGHIRCPHSIKLLMFKLFLTFSEILYIICSNKKDK